MSKGLSTEQAKKRLQEHGVNEIERREKTTPLDLIVSQFKENILIWILMVAAVLSLFAGEMAEFYFVGVIIIIIVAMGFFQEWKAEKAMEALREMTVPTATAYRDGELSSVPSRELVPGDVVTLEIGDKVPADAEVLDAKNLKVDESILTGESQSVTKVQGDEVYSGTVVARGRTEVEIARTGMDTKLGEIADELQEEAVETPLQRRVRDLAKKIGYFAIIVSIILFSIGMAVGVSTDLLVTVTIAVAVAVVPEALPLTMTLTLSLGMRDMARENAVVKKMLAVETLGSTTVICTDKTGTLTKNEMTIKRVFTDGKTMEVGGSGYSPEGDITIGESAVDVGEIPSLDWLIKGSSLCNDAVINFRDDGEKVHGDPTEAALVTLAEKTSYTNDELREEYPRVEEIQFTSERKRMTTVHEKPDGGGHCAFMKGAPHVVLERCSHVLEGDEEKPLTEEKVENILEKNKEFAGDALRVLALAYREDPPVSSEEEEVETEMVFVGLVGTIDPPREVVPEAIQACKTAGIKVKMVTGDNEDTARAIAHRIDLTDSSRVLTGDDMEGMSDEELVTAIEDVDIYARTHPGDKTRIIRALQENNEIVAMTGDGVNDAPAVSNADIGIGMGIKGTDVTREASDMILQDDNFATIVKAVKGGRRIYDNIEKFTTFLLSRNFTEVILIASVLAVLRDFALLPLLGMQVLFLNMIGQVGPGLGLGVDPAAEDIMNRPPRDPGRELLDRRNMFLIVTMAITMVLMAATAYSFADPFENIDLARTMAFISISIMIIVNAYNFRSLEKTIGEFNPFGNVWIILASAATLPLVFMAIYVPFFRELFGHVVLSRTEWLVAGGAGLVTIALIEAVKRMARTLQLRGS